ncbi:hypothetical protein OB236_23950 [Paenibacillus sp. WQ 127069]|uniref:Uncharacterized protein n=1 Tax=Paenibacillus baimaensis TaxID=2982185 RepID=A0ABT2UKK5_9BACL|nr:hypothetical protein [Paenibacillus sp. WQ 127069]MCU6795165.1 hypothetical protein [Paenibacillus sp. WQ 127069]
MDELINVLNLINELENYLQALSKSRAIQNNIERKISLKVALLRRSLESAAETGKEQSDAPARP